MSEQGEGDHVDLEDLVHSLGFCLGKITNVAKTGIVNEPINRVVILFQLLDEGAHLILLGQIHQVILYLQGGIGRLQLFLQKFQPITPTGDQDKSATERGKLTGKLNSKACGGPGDQGHIFELAHRLFICVVRTLLSVLLDYVKLYRLNDLFT